MSLYNDLTTVLTPYANKIKQNESDIDDIQEALGNVQTDLADVKPIVAEEVASTNIFTPISTRVYPDSGTAVINDDKSITITNVPRLSNVWIFAQDSDPITLEAGEYVLCLDPGLYVSGANSIYIQENSSGTYREIVTATGEQTRFTVAEDITAEFRISYVANRSGYITNWTGHIWINKDEAQEYIPVGARAIVPKEFVMQNQGTENAGKYLGINTEGDVIPQEIGLKPLEESMHSLLMKTRTASPVITFDNSYIKYASGEIDSYNNWTVIGFPLNKGDNLITTIGGSGCLLATCEDEEPTTSSTFNVIEWSSDRPYNVNYVAPEDMIIYLSSDKIYLSPLIVNYENAINVNYLDEKIDELSTKVDSSSFGGVGYSLDFNNAYEVIDGFVYSDGVSNPWIELENLSDFETYGTYIDNKIASIPDGDRFIWTSDVHYTSNKKRSGALIDYVRRKAGIKTIIHCGDVQNERPYAIDAAKDWFAFNKDYVGRIGSDFKQVCGDHDHNAQYWINETLRAQYNLTDPAETFFTCKFVQKVLTGYCENEIVYDTIYDDAVSSYGWSADDLTEYNAFKKMHYYFDDHSARTRFVVLFTNWSGTSYGFPYNKLGKASALHSQMEFLYKALVTIPNGYNVVVCGHDTVISLPVTEGGTTYYDLTNTIYNSVDWKSVTSMLAGLRNKSNNVVLKYTDWSTIYASRADVPTKVFDFTSAPDVNVIMTIGGDVHWDILSKTTTSNVDTITTLNSGDEIVKSQDVPHAIVMTDGYDRGYLDYATKEPICHPATIGTVDEQAFDVVTINNNGIFFTRIGSGNDRRLLFADEAE